MKSSFRIFFVMLLAAFIWQPSLIAQELHDANHPEVKKEIPLNRLVSDANAIVEGRFLNKRSFWNESHTDIFTVYTLQVYKVLKGAITGPNIEIILPGGRVGDVGQQMPGNPPIQEQTVALMFLVPATQISIGSTMSRDQQFKPLYGPYSAVVYDADASSTVGVGYLRSYHNIARTLYEPLALQIGHPLKEISYFDVNQFDQWAEKVQDRAIPHLPDAAPAAAKKKDHVNSASVSNRAAAQINALSITDFQPRSRVAGDFQELHITGSGFRDPNAPSVKPKVYFASPDRGNAQIPFPDSHIRLWDDSNIYIFVPSNDGTAAGSTAGSGRISVQTAGVTVTTPQSLQLDVPRSEKTTNFTTSGPAAYRQTRITSTNGQGGLTFRYEANMYDPDQEYLRVKSFQSAVRQWRQIAIPGPDNTPLLNIGDDVATGPYFTPGATACRVTFVPASDMSIPTRVAETGFFYGYCENSGTYVYTRGVVILVNASLQFNYYATSSVDVQTEQYDFKSAVLHELGHAIGLEHTSRQADMMYPRTDSGPLSYRRSFSEEPEIMGAYNIGRRSRTTPNTGCVNGNTFSVMTALTQAQAMSPQITVSPNTFSRCDPATVTTTASGATNYQWTPASRVVSLNVQSATVSLSNQINSPVFVFAFKDGMSTIGQVNFVENANCDPSGATSRTTAYPNPTKSDFTIDYQPKAETKDTEFVLYNSQGDVLRRFSHSRDGKRYSFPIQGLRAGLYYLRTIEEGRTYSTIRLQVQ